jgi:hypothetical protein
MILAGSTNDDCKEHSNELLVLVDQDQTDLSKRGDHP